MINIHTHIFKDISVPEKFLPLKLVRYLQQRERFKRFAKILHCLNPFSKNDVFDKMENFLSTGRKATQEEIFLEMKNQSPKDSKFVILPMDFEFMGAGKAKQTYIEQIDELFSLSCKYEEIIPFFAADPRRCNLLNYVKEYHKKGFKGIKIYCKLGFYPNDTRLIEVYKYCEENNLPVISHCTASNPVFFKGKRSDLRAFLNSGDNEVSLGIFESKREACEEFIQPKYYIEILKQFPNLRINLAHGGGYDEWVKYANYQNNMLSEIMYYCDRYKNLYFDCSFTASDSTTIKVLNEILETEIKNQILFGTDYYMNETEKNEKDFISDVINGIGIEKFELLQKNNLKFLGIE